MLTNPELSSFFGQMAMIRKSGISSVDGIGIMKNDAATEEGKKLLEKIENDLMQNGSLADSLKNSGEFPGYAVDMTRIAEQSGRLEEVSRSLSAYYKREDAIASGIRNAVSYPLVMIFMMFIVVGVLIVRVLPIFNNVYKELGTELTGAPQALLSWSAGSGVYLILVLAVLAAVLVFIAVSLKRSSSFRTRFFLSRLLYQKISEGRLAKGMSLTLQAGLDTDESLDLVSRLSEHPAVTQHIEACRQYLKEGDDFVSAVSKSALFPPMMTRMVDIGMRSGSLDEAMANISDQYDEEIDQRIQHLLSILEPSLVIILAIVVGVILLSVMLPLMSIMSGL